MYALHPIHIDNVILYYTRCGRKVNEARVRELGADVMAKGEIFDNASAAVDHLMSRAWNEGGITA